MYLFYRLANEKALSSLRRYHYYGLCVKDASPYRDTLLSNQRVSADELQGQRTETLAARAQQLCALPVNPQGLIADFPTVNCLPAPIRLQVNFLPSRANLSFYIWSLWSNMYRQTYAQ